MKKVYVHGEVCIFESESIPKEAKLVNGDGKKYIIAKSETVGNHHCIEEKEGVRMYEKNGILYLKSEVPVDVFCVMKERHDTITLEPGIYEIESAKEFDYLSGEKRAVQD